MALKWGIISASKLSSDFANVLNYLHKDGHQIVGVAARNKEKAQEFAGTHNIPVVYDSYQDLTKDESIEIVYIGCTSRSHFNLCKLVLSNKKHLVCEKPICLKYDEGRELVSMAQRNKLFFMEAVWSRFFPAYKELSRLLAANVIGDVVYVKADFGVPRCYLNTERYKKRGTIFEFGVYVLQLAIFVLGRNPNSVSAVAHIGEDEIDESVNYILKYNDGKTASLCTHSKIKMDNSAVIYGTKGHIKINDPFWAPTVISVNDGDEIRFPLPIIQGEKHFSHAQGLVYEAIEVKHCLENGMLESPRMTHEDTLVIARWQEEICKLIGSKYDF